MDSTGFAQPKAVASPELGAGLVPVRNVAIWVLGAYICVALLDISLAWDDGLLRAVGAAMRLAGPMAAAVACYAVARAAAPEARVSWILFGIAPVAAVAVTMWSAAVPLESDPSGLRTALLLLPVVHFLLAIGSALALGTGDRRLVTETAFDAGLLVGCAAIVVLRFGPSTLGELGPPSSSAIPGSAIALLGLLAAAGSLFATGLLLVSPRAHLSGRVAAGLVGAAVSFAAASALASTQPASACCAGNPAFELLLLGGWSFIVFAALNASLRVDGEIERLTAPFGGSLRQAVVPAAALILGLMAVDAVLHPPMRAETGFTLGFVGLLLALRTGHTLRIASRYNTDRLRLAQSRALIEVTHALADATELDRTLAVIAESACRLLEAPAAGIELLVENNRTLEIRAAHGLPPDALGMRFPVDGSFSGWAVKNRRIRVTTDAALDPYIQPASLALLGNAPTAAAPLISRNRGLGVLFAVRPRRAFFLEELELLGALADQAALAIENARLFEQVRRVSMTDPLTGLPNRRRLDHELEREFAAAQRGRKVLVILFDLDGFKEYNDRFGHLAGDDALRVFAEILMAENFATTVVTRYGGDEFLALLSDCDREGAEEYVERVRRRLPEEIRELGRGKLQVSAGIAEFEPGMESPEALIAAADAALYAEKARRTRPRRRKASKNLEEPLEEGDPAG